MLLPRKKILRGVFALFNVACDQSVHIFAPHFCVLGRGIKFQILRTVIHIRGFLLELFPYVDPQHQARPNKPLVARAALVFPSSNVSMYH